MSIGGRFRFKHSASLGLHGAGGQSTNGALHVATAVLSFWIFQRVPTY